MIRDKEDGKLEAQEAQQPDCKGKKNRKRPECQQEQEEGGGASLAITEASGAAAKAVQARAQAGAALPAQAASSAAVEQDPSEPWLADARAGGGDRVPAAALGGQASVHPIQLPECSLGPGLNFVGDFSGDQVGG